jgi:hypothetical protein
LSANALNVRDTQFPTTPVICVNSLHIAARYVARGSTVGRDAAYESVRIAANAGKTFREIDRDVIELLLDHVSDSQVIRTYNRAQRFAKRVHAARWWDAQLANNPE